MFTAFRLGRERMAISSKRLSGAALPPSQRWFAAEQFGKYDRSKVNGSFQDARVCDNRKKSGMIELTTQQMQALENSRAVPPQIVNPRTRETFVLLRVDEYQRLKEGDEYDDSPWTKQELQALAWEAGKSAGWEDMDEYDGVPEVP